MDSPVKKCSNAVSSHFIDIISLLIGRDRSGDSVPNFVIKLYTKVTYLTAAAYSLLFVKINQLHQTVVGMSSVLNNYLG